VRYYAGTGVEGLRNWQTPKLEQLVSGTAYMWSTRAKYYPAICARDINV